MIDNIDTEKRSGISAVAIGIVALLCCICVLVGGMVWYGYYAFTQAIPAISTFEPPTNDDPFFPVDPTEPVIEPELTRPPVDSINGETLQLLETTVVPPNEPKELACRMEGKCDIPDVMATTAAPRVVGDTDSFWVTDVGTNENTEVQATLRYVTPHVYFWVQDGVSYDDGEMKALMDAFENKIYPTNREFFGSEWSPGIDGDEHIYILYARGLGSSIAGYFSSADSVHPLVHEFSNAHEMFLFNADNTFLGEEFTYGVLAHEFQHMIHWNQDLNETSWLNEGSSELAAFLNDYDPGGFDWLYITDPDMQLNDWPNDQDATTPHYGAGFLFMTYFLDRFGEDATKALIKDPANGLDSVENALREIDATDPVTGQPISADAFFMDWAVTNFLLDKSVGDGRYIYNNYPAANRASATETIYNCPQTPIKRDVHQYGVDYIAIECAGDHTISFTGSTVTGLLPADPYSGDYAFWSNKGDESDMTLTREFDFTNVSGPIELSYQTWYDIETDWDYLYLETSEDGVTWEIVTTPSGTDTDPSGNSYGWGYTGVTNGWIEEKVDLSQFAGKKVFVRFEYVTDAAVNGEGLLLDDVKVEAAGYSSDFETDDGGWEAKGFVRVQNVLPQTFGLSLILTSDSSVTMIPLNPDQTAEISISLQSGQKAYLVVSGTTRFTRELASYQIEIK
ncbi:MAG TPA: immune inhibitor A [Anaerolineales bacterium]|nr:immune inhibitor A [Anaerolineales bacterium]HMX76094.1 immune inhibitor A [Anaerolineales bacterium]HMZ44994.1 immune inhibitor A [Anaerolineales bacterium]HNA55881.1 immune inhibitor A [Anaerolineales bacterium]HNB87654.1 immune inhibitor A [Anaerolineales bacterium]